MYPYYLGSKDKKVDYIPNISDILGVWSIDCKSFISLIGFFSLEQEGQINLLS